MTRELVTLPNLNPVANEPFGKLLSLTPRQGETETESEIETQNIPVATTPEQDLRIRRELAHHAHAARNVVCGHFLQLQNPVFGFARGRYFAPERASWWRAIALEAHFPPENISRRSRRVDGNALGPSARTHRSY